MDAWKHTSAGWFTPLRLLLLLCVSNLLTSIDRGAIASNGVNGAPDTAESKGSGIQGEFGVSLFQDGLFPAAFNLGLLLSTQVFAEASRNFNALRLVGVGFALWTAGVVGCGASLGFLSLLLSRAAVGVGQAAFGLLACPFIDDHAPPAKKARWLATYSLCLPTGYAAGYIYGGLVGSALGWRAAFLLEAAAMAPLAAFCLRAAPVDIRHSDACSEGEAGRMASLGSGGSSSGGSLDQLCLLGGTDDPASLQPDSQNSSSGGCSCRAGLGARVCGMASDLRRLWRHPVYVLGVAAMTLYSAVLASLGYYAPKAGRAVFGIAPQVADLVFGAVTISTGICGTAAGGVVLDRLGSTLRNALLVCALGTAVGCACLVLAFMMARGFAAFCVALACGEFAMFMTEAPSNAICMWSVPTPLRPFAISASVAATVLLGVVPGPPLLGLTQGLLHNWRLSMTACSLVLLAAAALYAGAMRRAPMAAECSMVVLSPLGAAGEEEGRGRGGSRVPAAAADGRGTPGGSVVGDEGTQQQGALGLHPALRLDTS